MTVSRFVVLTLAMASMLSSRSVSAQPLGSFAWQLQPFCNNLNLSITQQGALFTIEGFDDQCGAPQRAPLVGVATQNPDGTIGFGLHIVSVPGGRPVDVDARISIGNLSGPWRDSAGNAGTFAFNARTGGTPRPLPTIPGVLIAPGSITGTTIADGSITPQKLSVPLPRLASSGLTTGALNLTGTNVIVRTVTLAIPAAGQVLVNASGLFGFAVGIPVIQHAWCSISTGTAVETAHYLYARTATDTAANMVSNVPFAGSRVYNVTAGATFTVNLVCSGASDTAFERPNLQTGQLNALFVPD